ncbi:putative leucine-rich repeat-containing protein DDB_G0290503 [Maniola hyperantus]|uniref:putative leucine-rich repeat-containing protein DDB_G0290503 n=1 Tax=Aphantopus hyperantus TaxID=2795564 RepID=UPI00374A5791
MVMTLTLVAKYGLNVTQRVIERAMLGVSLFGVEEIRRRIKKYGLRYHFDCIYTSSTKSKEFSVDCKSNWICPSCRSKQPKGDNTNTPVRGPAGASSETSPSSNITFRRMQPSSMSQTQEDITLDNVKQLMKEEMNILLSKMENNLTKTLDTKTKEMFKEINEIKEAMSFINNQYEDLKKELQGRLIQVEELKGENNNLKSIVKDLNSRLSTMEQHSRMSNLEIQCLPEYKAENLPNVILQIGKVTGSGITDADIHKCTRVAKIIPGNPRPRSVIVKFSSPRIRDTYLASVINFNKKNKEDKLNTNHIGIGGEKKPIYVVDHLTSELKKIHASARQTAKKLNYKFVWVKNGRVFLRKSEGSEHIVVRNIEQLEQLNS